MDFIIGLIYFLLSLGVIIFIHELGHLIVAKKNGVYCHEFSIGMGPKLKKLYTDKTGTKYYFRAIPIGGFVILSGLDSDDIIGKEISKDKHLDSKSPKVRLKILMAGSGMNIILGATFFFLAFFFWGSPIYSSNEVTVMINTPVETAGIETGDKIISIDDKEINNFFDIKKVQKTLTGEIVTIVYYDQTEQVEKTSEFEPVLNEKNSSYLMGVTPIEYKFNLLSSILSMIFWTLFSIIYVFLCIIALFSSVASISDLSGPIGILSISSNVVENGGKDMLMWISLLSINIGIFNMFPIPGLDGGHIIFVIIEWVRKKPVNKKIKDNITMIGMLALIALIIYVSIGDIIKIFG